ALRVSSRKRRINLARPRPILRAACAARLIVYTLRHNGVRPMPMYEYTCSDCKKSFERLVRSADDKESVACPACGSRKTARQLSVFAVGSQAPKPAPTGCGRCGGPGPCAFE